MMNMNPWKKTIIIVTLIICEAFVISYTICGQSEGDKVQAEAFELGQGFFAKLPKTAPREVPGEEGLPKADLSDPNLILVNKKNPVEKDYKPEDLYPIKYYAQNRSQAGRYMKKEAAEAFNAMAEAGLAEGVEILCTTAYRSYAFQATLYENYKAQYGPAEADKFSAKPGTSEHQTGLAVDITAHSVGLQLTLAFGETDEGKWVRDHAAEYGFILRYPKGREEITGYMYEPWHFRYVGPDNALNMKKHDLTLEEYLMPSNI